MNESRIELVQGNIATLQVDAVVTADNESLLGGGGVDGAIHRAAGPGLLEECRTIGICPEGEARIAGGYLLSAKHILHTVGPVWDGGGYGERETRKSAYRNTLRLAEENGIRSIAFPCIATGVYGFPKDQACEIAVSSVTDWLDQHELPERVVFCCFEEEDFELYQDRLGVL